VLSYIDPDIPPVMIVDTYRSSIYLIDGLNQRCCPASGTFRFSLLQWALRPFDEEAFGQRYKIATFFLQIPRDFSGGIAKDTDPFLRDPGIEGSDVFTLNRQLRQFFYKFLNRRCGSTTLGWGADDQEVNGFQIGKI
jgi:hypothetical protein